jgi:hypothetical protein
MVDGGRRLILATLAWLMAAAALPAMTLGAQAAATPAVSLSIHIGYRDTVKLGGWMPVAVDVTNRGPDLNGTLEVQDVNSNAGNFGPSGGAVIYQAPLSLAGGATKHLVTYVELDQPDTITTRVVANGRQVASQDTNVSNVTSSLIGVLSDQPSTLDGLASVHSTGVAPVVVHLQLADISDSPQVLRAFDLLAIDDFSTDTLTAGQRSAISDFVFQGGSLLIGTGAGWHKTLAGLPGALVPMNVTGSIRLGASRSLGGQSGVEVATGALAGGRSWLGDGDQPLLVEKFAGQGLVTMSTFDWNQDSIATWSGTPALLRQVLVREIFGGGSTAAFQPGSVTSVAQKSASLSQVLSNLPSLNLPAWWLIGALVLAYILLVGPVNYFVLRAINHRALAWITLPVIAIVAAGGAYGAASLTKGRSVQTNQVTMIHVEPGSDRAYQESYTGIITPTRGDFEIAVGGAPSLVSPIAGNFQGGPLPTSTSGLIRVDPANGTVTIPGMTAFSLRGFATESMTAAPHLVATAQLVNGKLVGTVQNQSSIAFSDVLVIAGNAFQTLKALAPGASVSFSLTPAVANPFNGPPGYTQIYPSNLYGMPGAGSADAERIAETRTQLLSLLSVNGFKGFAPSTVPLVVGWTDQPAQSITVSGERPKMYAVTAVVVDTPVAQIGPGTLPAGVVPGRLVDMDGQSSGSGAPGTVAMQSGSIVYSFLPTLAPGTHLSAVVISSTDPFSGKGGPPTQSGSPATLTGQVWDWSRSSWVDVVYQDNANTTVPDSAVSPSTGEVRLKLSSDGAFSSGWLSLAGTVQ